MVGVSPAAAISIARRLKRTVGPDAVVLHASSGDEMFACTHCHQQQSISLSNRNCSHVACTDCWATHAADMVSLLTNQHSSKALGTFPSCIEPGCDSCMPKEMLEFAAETWPTVAHFLKALTASEDSVTEACYSTCSICLEPHRVVLRNAGCQHTACDSCWKRWVESQVPQCASRRTIRVQCFGLRCQQPITDDVWYRACSGSETATQFARDASSQVARMKRTAGRQAIFATSQLSLLCPMCLEFRPMLLSNQHCDHAACEGCWASWAEGELATCREELRLRPRCFLPGCSCAMAAGIWRHTCTQSRAARSFADDMEASAGRLMRAATAASSSLLWAARPCEPGPICGICFQRVPALIANSCGHYACEDCWCIWIQNQLPQCRGRRAREARCLGGNCLMRADIGTWRHVCTVSEPVRSLEHILEKRQRLQANELYPTSMQVECPRAECLGLAYRGFSTLMCFMCEHQWQAESDDLPPVTIGEALMTGLDIKRCPGCGEPIIKNGGCDHMTCRCKHEFWWSTLAPCRR